MAEEPSSAAFAPILADTPTALSLMELVLAVLIAREPHASAAARQARLSHLFARPVTRTEIAAALATLIGAGLATPPDASGAYRLTFAGLHSVARAIRTTLRLFNSDAGVLTIGAMNGMFDALASPAAPAKDDIRD